MNNYMLTVRHTPVDNPSYSYHYTKIFELRNTLKARFFEI